MLDEKVKAKIVRDLQSAIGENMVFHEKADLIPFARDTFALRFSEEDKNIPDIVVTPSSVSEVVAVVKIAYENGIPLIPKGGGTSRTGMLVPLYGGIILDTIKLNRLLKIDRFDMLVKVQAGMNLQELELLLNKQGLTIGHEQGSQKIATVGGAISTAAYSRKNQKYGNIWERIASMEVVLGNGSVLRTGPDVPYTSSGIALSGVFVGAEGTLGIITEVTLRVEAAPESSVPMMILFQDYSAAREAAQKVMEAGVSFIGGSVWEDERGFGALGQEQKRAAMIMAFEGAKEEAEASAKCVKLIVEHQGGIVLDKELSKTYWDDFTAHWCGMRASIGNEDVIVAYVPRSREQEYFEKLRKEIIPRHGLKLLPGESRSFDFGNHMILTTRFSIPPTDEGWRSYMSAIDEVAKLITSLGGTITACHGVGIIHKSHIRSELGREYLVIVSDIKKVLDPKGILNPGKKFQE